MGKRGSGPDFIEALARGLEVIQALGDAHDTKGAARRPEP
ncbi:hypothetical protein FB459_0679 [Yimella lutea]|uniref:Uncharacterized protein n=1 Tax=Yimella lutea TaxID=587872 RepID=A0A542ED62_9MICO|nr:hypothetical protein FB459_0679 [Yimella lutea]